MKPSHLLAIAVAALAPAVVGCAVEGQEGLGAEFPPSAASDPVVATPTSGPGEAPIPIDTASASAPVASRPPPPPPPQPRAIVPGETTEEEYNARPPDPEDSENQDEYADQDPSALTDFRAALDPYGSWVDDPNYGTVWTPDPGVVGDDFTPYVSAGRWTYDDYQNWVWVSDYDWGWAPFHYGRWANLGNRWGWIPGRQYAGAWVSWRTGYGGYDYLGWAPLAPAWGWRNGLAFGLGFAPAMSWSYCGTHGIFSPGLGGHLVTGPTKGMAAANSRGSAPPAVAASGGRVIAHPTVGPAPSTVGIGSNEIRPTPANNRGVMHAQQYARPSTAQSYGAHVAFASSASSEGYARSSTGLGRSFRNDPIATAPQYRGISPGPHYFPSHRISVPYSGGGYGYEGPRGSGYSAGPYGSPYGGRYGGATVYGRGYGGYPGVRPGGAAHSNSGGSSSSSEEHEEFPGFHSGGSRGGGFRGGGGHGGGGHGGGGHR